MIISKEETKLGDVGAALFTFSLIFISFILTYFILKNGLSKTFQFIKYLFKKLKSDPLLILNLVAIVIIFAFIYRIDTRLVNIEKRFGGVEKLKCSEGEVQTLMNNSVVRIIGSFGEGSGFPLTEETIITNYHVIEGEPSPKIVFPDGRIETPTKILASKEKDIAALSIDKKLDPLPVYGWLGNTSVSPNPSFGEPVYAAGYPYGSQIPGDARIIKGSYNGVNYQESFDMSTIEASIQLNPGMSGGPLVNSCGQVLGVSTAGISGLSMFLEIEDVQKAFWDISDEAIAKIEVDTETPEGVVQAFYTYIKARDLESAFDLLSGARRAKITSFEEWTRGYNQTLQVDLIMSKVDEEDENKVFIKIESQDWVDGDLVYKYFQGFWTVVQEPALSGVEGEGDYKLNESNIAEIDEPDWEWFYYWEDEI